MVSRFIVQVYYANGHIGIAEVEFLSSDATAETFEMPAPIEPGKYVRLGLISNYMDPNSVGDDVIQVDEVEFLAGCNSYGDNDAVKLLIGNETLDGCDDVGKVLTDGGYCPLPGYFEMYEEKEECLTLKDECQSMRFTPPNEVVGGFSELIPDGIVTKPGNPGWVVLLKTNGDDTFQYDASHWGDTSSVLNAETGPREGGNAKYSDYNDMPFDSVRVCTGTLDESTCSQKYTFSQTFNNAAELFNGPWRREGIVQSEWDVLFKTDNGDRDCGMLEPGFNTVCNDNNRARWGYCNNIPNQGCQTSDSSDADGAIGLGLHGQDCCPMGAGHTNYFVSNSANGGHEKRSQAWIVAQRMPPPGWSDKGVVTEPVPPAYLGTMIIGDGPNWDSSPPSRSCADECEAMFPGIDMLVSQYACSINRNEVTNTAEYEVYGGSPRIAPDWFVQGGCMTYDHGGCASAFVADSGSRSENHCFAVPIMDPDDPAFSGAELIESWTAESQTGASDVQPRGGIEGWRVILKSDGDDTFQYDSPHWGDVGSVVNEEEDPNLDGNAKYPEYNTMQFTKIRICVGVLEEASCTMPFEFTTPFTNAAQLFNGAFRREGVVQAEWDRLFAPSGDRDCGMQRPGFNTVCNDNNRARWGYCNNIPNQGCQTSDGSDADGAIGLGLHGQDCCPMGAGHTNYFVSNSANGGNEKRSQAWILIEDASRGSSGDAVRSSMAQCNAVFRTLISGANITSSASSLIRVRIPGNPAVQMCDDVFDTSAGGEIPMLGTATASQYWGGGGQEDATGWQPSYAFDGNEYTGWDACCGVTPSWITFTFNTPVRASRYLINTMANECPATWTLYGDNTAIATESGQTCNNHVFQPYTIASPGLYQAYKLTITGLNTGGDARIREIKFEQDATGSTCHGTDCDGTGTTGTTSAGSAAEAFDGDESTWWDGQSSGEAYPNQRVGVTYGSSMKVSGYRFSTHDGECPTGWDLFATNDPSNAASWVLIDTQTGQNCHDGRLVRYDLALASQMVYYTSWQWRFNGGIGGDANGIRLREIALWSCNGEEGIRQAPITNVVIGERSGTYDMVDGTQANICFPDQPGYANGDCTGLENLFVPRISDDSISSWFDFDTRSGTDYILSWWAACSNNTGFGNPFPIQDVNSANNGNSQCTEDASAEFSNAGFRVLSNGDTAWTSSQYGQNCANTNRDIAQAFDGNWANDWANAYHGECGVNGNSEYWRTTPIKVRYSWGTNGAAGLAGNGVPNSQAVQKTVGQVNLYQLPNHEAGRVEIRYLDVSGSTPAATPYQYWRVYQLAPNPNSGGAGYSPHLTIAKFFDAAGVELTPTSCSSEWLRGGTPGNWASGGVGNPCTNVFDDNEITYAPAELNGNTPVVPFDFTTAVAVESVRMDWLGDHFPGTYKMQSSADGQTWNDVGPTIDGGPSNDLVIHTISGGPPIMPVENPSSDGFGDDASATTVGDKVEIFFDAVTTSMIEISIWVVASGSNANCAGANEIEIMGVTPLESYAAGFQEWVGDGTAENTWYFNDGPGGSLDPASALRATLPVDIPAQAELDCTRDLAKQTCTAIPAPPNATARVVGLLMEEGASAAGWSNSEVTNVGSAGTVHGPWGNDVTDVSIDVIVPASMTTCEVSWRSWAADSRDGETDRVLIDGNEVWSLASQCHTGSDGWEAGPPDFPNPWGGQNGQVCFMEVNRIVDCSAGTLNIRFQSGIDQGEADESWAFSDVTVIGSSGTVAVILSEDTQGGAVATGWSNSEVTNVGSAGTVHGPWGNDVTDVSIDIPIPAGYSTCEVRWRSWAADSRDGETDRVLIDGNEVWSLASQCHTGSDGWEAGPPDFPNPWGGQNGQVCFQEVRVHVLCSGTMNLRFQSAIDQGEADESWAFSGVRVTGHEFDWAEYALPIRCEDVGLNPFDWISNRDMCLGAGTENDAPERCVATQLSDTCTGAPTACGVSQDTFGNIAGQNQAWCGQADPTCLYTNPRVGMADEHNMADTVCILTPGTWSDGPLNNGVFTPGSCTQNADTGGSCTYVTPEAPRCDYANYCNVEVQPSAPGPHRTGAVTMFAGAEAELMCPTAEDGVCNELDSGCIAVDANGVCTAIDPDGTRTTYCEAGTDSGDCGDPEMMVLGELVFPQIGGSLGTISQQNTVWTQGGQCSWCGVRGATPMCDAGHESDTYTWSIKIEGGTYHQIGVAANDWNGRNTNESPDNGRFALLYSHHSGWNRHRGAARPVSHSWSGTWDNTNKGSELHVTLDCAAFTFSVRTEQQQLGVMSFPNNWGTVYSAMAGQSDDHTYRLYNADVPGGFDNTCKYANDGNCDYAPCSANSDQVDCQAEIGCSDPHASNYQEGAFKDDGSCAHLAHVVNDQIPSGGSARTFSAWIKPECHGEYGNIFGYGDTQATTPAGFALGVKCSPPAFSRMIDVPYSGHSYSSIWGSEAVGTGHGRGRFDSPQGWSANSNNQNQWMKMVLSGGEAWVTGLVTQSRAGGQRVETFKVAYKNENDAWQMIQCGGSDCIYPGNTQDDRRKETLFAEPVYTASIRIHPWTWSGHVSMRAALLVRGEEPKSLGLKVQQPNLSQLPGLCAGINDWDTTVNGVGTVVTCVDGTAYALYDTDMDPNNGFQVSDMADMRGRCNSLGLDVIEIRSADQVQRVLRPLVQDQCNGWNPSWPSGIFPCAAGDAGRPAGSTCGSNNCGGDCGPGGCADGCGYCSTDCSAGCPDGSFKPGYNTNTGRGIPLGHSYDDNNNYRSLLNPSVDVSPIFVELHNTYGYNGDHLGAHSNAQQVNAGFGWGRNTNDPGIEDWRMTDDVAVLICSDNGPPPPIDNSTIWLPGLAVDFMWTHIVVSMADDNTLTVYINGDLIGVFTDLVGVPIDTTPVSEQFPFVIGAGAWIDFPYNQRWDFNGLIHSVKIWDRELTAREVFLDQDTCVISPTAMTTVMKPQCTGIDDGSGNAIAGIPGQSCTLNPLCALNPDTCVCAVQGGDCVFAMVPAPVTLPAGQNFGISQTAYSTASLVAYYVMGNDGTVVDKTANTVQGVDNTWVVGGTGERNATTQECPCKHADEESNDCLHLVEPEVQRFTPNGNNIIISTGCAARYLPCNDLKFHSGGTPMPDMDDTVTIVNSAIPSGPDARTISAWIKVDCNNINGYGGTVFSYGRSGQANTNPAPGRGNLPSMVFKLMIRPQCNKPVDFPGGFNFLEGGGNINLALHSGGSNSLGWSSIGNFPKATINGQWTHIAVTADATGSAEQRFSFCVNGVCLPYSNCPGVASDYGPQGCGDNSGYLDDMNTWPVSEEYPFVIGSGAYGEGGARGSGGMGIGNQWDYTANTGVPAAGCGDTTDCFDFAGSIANLKIWNRRLTDEEVGVDFSTCITAIGSGVWSASAGMIGSYGLDPEGTVVNQLAVIDQVAVNQTDTIGVGPAGAIRYFTAGGGADYTGPIHSENFEDSDWDTTGLFRQNQDSSQGGNQPWTRTDGNTPSSGTGPVNGAYQGQWYIYTEASSHFNEAFLLDLDHLLPASTAMSVDFWYHMYGEHMGSLDIEISPDGTNTWTSVWGMFGAAGQQQTGEEDWRPASAQFVTLGSPTKMRLNSVSGTSFKSDICIDALTIGGGSGGAATGRPSGRPDNMIDMTGGTGGQTGQTVYSDIPSMPRTTVTSSNPTYNNGNYYYIQYLFDGVYQSIDNHPNYWLGQSSSDTTFTINFGTPVDLTRVKLAPKCRSDTNSMDYQLSISGVAVSARFHDTSVPVGTMQEYPINQVVTELTLQIWMMGGGYMSFNEIQLFVVDPSWVDPNTLVISSSSNATQICEMPDTVYVDSMGWASRAVISAPSGCCPVDGCNVLLDEVGQYANNAATCPPPAPGQAGGAPLPVSCTAADAGECRTVPAVNTLDCVDYQVTEEGPQTPNYISSDGVFGSRSTTTSDDKAISMFSEFGEGVVWVGGPPAGADSEFFHYKIEFAQDVSLIGLSLTQDGGGTVWITDATGNELVRQDCYGPGLADPRGNWGSSNPGTGAMCEGDCDSDAQCNAGLSCFQRGNGEEIPGCGSGGTSNWDYCHDPNWNTDDHVNCDISFGASVGTTFFIHMTSTHSCGGVTPGNAGGIGCWTWWKEPLLECVSPTGSDMQISSPNMADANILNQYENLGTLHGPWGNNMRDISMTFFLPPPSTGRCSYAWRQWYIDSRDNERDFTQIDGQEVWGQSIQMHSDVRCRSGWTIDPTGLVPNPWNGNGGPACYKELSFERPCSGSTVIRFQSAIDQGIGDESWAISHVVVTMVADNGIIYADIDYKPGDSYDADLTTSSFMVPRGTDSPSIRIQFQFPTQIVRGMRMTLDRATTGNYDFMSVKAKNGALNEVEGFADVVDITNGIDEMEPFPDTAAARFPHNVEIDAASGIITASLSFDPVIANQLQFEFTVNSPSGRNPNSQSATYMPLYEMDLVGACLGGPCADKFRNIGRVIEQRECKMHDMVSKMLNPPLLFTNLGKGDTAERDCRDGPTSSAGYAGTPLEGMVTMDQGMQLWEVPQSGRYRITACGARGGYHNSGSRKGGPGACMSGIFQLDAGTVLRILVGQKGDDRNSNGDWGAGGGGGTFVVKNVGWTTVDSILLIAGGGAAAADYGNNDQVNMGGSILEAGTDGTCGASGGTAGQGAQGQSASGGAGFFQDGQSGHGDKGDSFISGGVGADYHWDGGFGGGGGPYNGGGGGGGWSGGGACDGPSSGGGGSLNNGDEQENWSAQDPSLDGLAGDYKTYGPCPDGCPNGNYGQGRVYIE